MNVNALVPKIKFEILSIQDSKSIYILDTSDWKHLKDKATPYIDIKVPGSKKYIRNLLNTNAIKVFRSDALELSSKREIDELCDLPDGIYWVKILLCDSTDLSFEKPVLRYQLLQNQIDEKINSGKFFDKKSEEKFTKIYVYLRVMESFIRVGNTNKAMDMYGRISEILKYI